MIQKKRQQLIGSPSLALGRRGRPQGSLMEQVGCLGHCHFTDWKDTVKVPWVVGMELGSTLQVSLAEQPE